MPGLSPSPRYLVVWTWLICSGDVGGTVTLWHLHMRGLVWRLPSMWPHANTGRLLVLLVFFFLILHQWPQRTPSLPLTAPLFLLEFHLLFIPNVQSRWIYGFYPWDSSGIGSFKKSVKAIILLHMVPRPCTYAGQPLSCPLAAESWKLDNYRFELNLPHSKYVSEEGI